MATARKSRVYTISLPAELARKAEALAKRDSRSMSELFREAFRSYYAQQGLRSSAPKGAVAAPGHADPTKDIAELFAPLRGLNLDFGRNPSTG
jgi:predicted transcriptional regulator